MRLGKDAKVELIRHVPLFSRLSKKRLREVAAIADEIDVPAGKVLAKEGDRGREFFALLEGEVEVVQGGRLLRHMKEGEFFGEIALVTKVPRTATVTTVTPGRLLVITERDFGGLVKNTPDVGRAVAEALAERLAPDLPV
ncbi:MAG: cyclic nucleotide-binding domain-containing protein [Gaiellaceae bacterium]|jgi:CRP-like cAMP-binding protein